VDSFESVIATILEYQGYWIQTSFKVDLTKEEKRKIGRQSTPRWEIDLVAYKAASNELLLVECKSYLNSPGVRYLDVEGSGRDPQLYKLFTDDVLRRVVTARIKKQLHGSGSCLSKPKVTLCLAAGNIYTEADRLSLKELFRKKGWRLLDPTWI
jgi:hypothetical protein